jgi:drug/metabolite transporter (DMT)-like permease
MTRQSKGYLLAIASYASSAAGTIASKWLIVYTSPLTTAVLWYVAGTLVTPVLLLAFQGGFNWRSLRANLKVYLQISLVMSAAAVCWFTSVDLAGPSIVAFVQQLGVVFGILFGAIVLHERIDPVEKIGGAIAIVGALVISYHTGTGIQLGMLLALLNSLGVAIQNLLVKQHVKEIDTLELIFVRSLVALVTISVYSLLTGGLVMPRTWMLPSAFIGSSVGFVGVNILLYRALSHVDLSKVSILAVTSAPMVMVASVFVFHIIPTPLQLVGSGLILCGTVLIVGRPMFAARRPAARA